MVNVDLSLGQILKLIVRFLPHRHDCSCFSGYYYSFVHSASQVEEDGMGRACSTHGVEEDCI
jgi:hypothetical protein